MFLEKHVVFAIVTAALMTVNISVDIQCMKG